MVPDEVCEAILLFNREARVSELILRKFMFSSSWTRAWVLVVVEPVEDSRSRKRRRCPSMSHRQKGYPGPDRGSPA